MDYEDQYNSGMGGGFLPDDASSKADNTKKRDFNAQTIRPVTIKQILGISQPMEGDDVLLDNQPLTLVRFVAVLREANHYPTNFTLTFQDSTGSISGRMSRPTDDSIAQSKINEQGQLLNRYADVVGEVRFFQNKINVSLISVKPVEDFNQVTFHICQVLQAHTKFSGKAPINTIVPKVENINNMDTQTYGYKSTAAPSNDSSMGSDINAKIIGYIKQNAKPNVGVEKAKVIQYITSLNYTPDQSRSIYSNLEDEGTLYPTVDENHVNVL